MISRVWEVTAAKRMQIILCCAPSVSCNQEPTTSGWNPFTEGQGKGEGERNARLMPIRPLDPRAGVNH